MLSPRAARPLILLAVLSAFGTAASAQSAYEIQVYGSETAAPGATFVEWHDNTAPKGPPAGPGAIQPDEHAYHETLEITRGFTDWFETGFYVFSSARDGQGWNWVGDHVRPRVRVPPSWGWPIGVSLSFEAGWLRQGYADTRWDMEIRPIIDWRNGRFYAAFNPALERGLRFYDGGSASFQFAPAAKMSWDFPRGVTAGLEYYGALGPVENFTPGPQQQHQLFPVLDLDFGPRWEFEAGAGFGLTRATDDLVLKTIIGHRFGGPPTP